MLKLMNRTNPQFVDDIFGNELLNSFNNFIPSENQKILPKVNIYENEKDYRIELAAPGLDKNDFKIEVKNDVLKVSSEKEYSNSKEEEKVLRNEYSYSSFKRSFILPEEIKIDKIVAKHENGILKISIPKTEKAKDKLPRSIIVE